MPELVKNIETDKIKLTNKLTNKLNKKLNNKKRINKKNRKMYNFII